MTSDMKRRAALALVCLAILGQIFVVEGAAAYEWKRPLQEGDYGRDVKALEVQIAGWFRGEIRRSSSSISRLT